MGSLKCILALIFKRGISVVWQEGGEQWKSDYEMRSLIPGSCQPQHFLQNNLKVTECIQNLPYLSLFFILVQIKAINFKK